MEEKIQKFREYLDYIEEHYNNVQKAWKLINDKCQGKDFPFICYDCRWNEIDSNIKKHDLSKLSMEEFTQYRQFFFPCKDEEKNKELFMQGWDHHQEVNHHHWQKWTKTDTCNSVYQEVAFIENICDWVAMGLKFGDTARDYYEKNRDNIELPKWAEKYMYGIFECIYDKTEGE